MFFSFINEHGGVCILMLCCVVGLMKTLNYWTW